MVEVNILAPHLDDAVISCWHQIEQTDTKIITVFAGIPETDKKYWWDRMCRLGGAKEAMVERRKENAASLADSEVEIINLDYLDRLYRPPARNIAEIADKVEEVSKPGSVYLAAAGIGTYLRMHPDHKTTREVGLELQRRGREVSFFADVPYSLPFRNFSKWPLRLSKKMIESKLRQTVDVTAVELAPEQQARKRKAVMLYKSQFSMINVFALGALTQKDTCRWEGLIKANLA